MTQYLYTVPILLVTILCMLFLTITNKNILVSHKKGFFIVFIGACVVTICEVLSLVLDGSANGFKIIHFLSNYLGFLLTPILITFFATSIGRFRHFQSAVIGIGIYFLLCNVLIITKQLFFIDGQNNYHRGNLFFLYIISYFLAIAYLLYETLQQSQQGFLQHKIFAYLLSCCFLVSTSIQVFNSEVYTTRITVVLSLCVYYAYNIELSNLFDKLTGILNQGTYLRNVKELKEQQSIIIMDVDNFKYVNDHYGHQYGDKCLIAIAHTIRSIFEKHGQCYRIGGDEFAVVLKRCHNVERLIVRFEKALANKFRNTPYQLSASIGYATYEENDSAEAVIQRADFNMYTIKNRKKALK